MEDTRIELRRGALARSRILILGGILGAAAGVGAAYLLLEAREKRIRTDGGDVPVLSAKGLMRVGWMVAGMLRRIGELAGEE